MGYILPRPGSGGEYRTRTSKVCVPCRLSRARTTDSRVTGGATDTACSDAGDIRMCQFADVSGQTPETSLAACGVAFSCSG